MQFLLDGDAQATLAYLMVHGHLPAGVHDGDRAVGCIKRKTGSPSARQATAATVRVPLAGLALPAG